MVTASQQEVTGLLLAWNGGDPTALERLIPLVYDELRRLARHYMDREAPGHDLRTTALVHETYLRLVDASRVRWQNRAHFLALSARLMRRVLVEFARARQAQKRGGGLCRVDLEEALTVSDEQHPDLVALDEALSALASFDERKSQVVELRFFGGLTVEETAEALKVSSDTVMRDWKVARTWLLRELRREASRGP
jgi:RNA polymerase sigma factor (TIGR02999 family)